MARVRLCNNNNNNNTLFLKNDYAIASKLLIARTFSSHVNILYKGMSELMKCVAVRLFNLKSFAKHSYRYAKSDMYIKQINILFSYSIAPFVLTLRK